MTLLVEKFDLRLSNVYDETVRLVGTPTFIRRRIAVERALANSLSLSADEVGDLVA